MSINRRKFTKLAILGGSSAIAGSGIFFPKPAEAYSLEYSLSTRTAGNVFGEILQASIAEQETENLAPDTNSVVVSIVQSAQAEFTNREYNDGQTPFAQRLSSINNPIWGRQKNEEVGPNPGFATVQTSQNIVRAVSFSGSTTVGVSGAIDVLSTDARLSPAEIDGALIPWRERYEDWGTWQGDYDQVAGRYTGTSFSSYQTRLGQVIRRYDVIEPGPGGFGNIQFIVEAGGQPQRTMNITVRFL